MQLGELEEKIMQILWQSGGWLKPAAVQSALPEKLAYTTVMTVLHRLWQKKMVKRQKERNSFVYQSIVSREEFLRSSINEFVTNLRHKYGELAISQLVDSIGSND